MNHFVFAMGNGDHCYLFGPYPTTERQKEAAEAISEALGNDSGMPNDLALCVSVTQGEPFITHPSDPQFIVKPEPPPDDFMDFDW